MIGSVTQSTLRLIEGLEDQLDQYPLGAVIRTHAGLVDEGFLAWSQRLALLGSPGRKYWDHPVELLYEQVGVLLGTMFVLVQAAVTETVSIAARIYELNGRDESKKSILRLEAPTDNLTGLSYPEVANAAANYYKHRFEWPTTWVGATNRQQLATMSILRLIGMSDTFELTDNLMRASDIVMRDSRETNMAHLSRLVVEDWRERLSARLRQEFV